MTLKAEWEPHGAVLLAWPHPDTDWAYMLPEVHACYRDLIDALRRAGEQVILIGPERFLPALGLNGVTEVAVETNDTWIRDYGPLTLSDGTSTLMADFRFNAWGQKFASNLDNQVNRRLAEAGLLPAPLCCHKDFVLEGGSIESDGCGTLLTTSCCLLAPNRNEPMDRAAVEAELRRCLGVSKVLWLDVSPMEGDDTDGHIDTMARLAPGNTILYNAGIPVNLLRNFTNAAGEPFNLIELPLPDPIFDPDDGSPLPATYANYLVCSRAILLPVYGQPDNDRLARQTLQVVFHDRPVIPVDCRALIRQHGSLHCATMQIPLP